MKLDGYILTVSTFIYVSIDIFTLTAVQMLSCAFGDSGDISGSFQILHGYLTVIQIMKHLVEH